jgi:Skp family chaperone for outer membrane proteins
MKSDTPASLRAIVLGAIVLCITASLTGAQAGEDKGGLRIAVFDQGRARNEYKFVAKAEQDFQKKIEDTDFMLGVWRTNTLLAQPDQEKLGNLLLEEKRAPGTLDNAKKADLKKLQEQSKGLLDEFNRLQSNAKQLTPAERDRINILIRSDSDTGARIQATSDRVRAELQKFQDDANITIMKDTREAVQKIAKEKNYTLVLSSAVAWYGDSDITDAVIGTLNKK